VVQQRNISPMRTYVFVWFDFGGRRRLYVTRALSIHRAQLRYVAYQLRREGLHYIRLYWMWTDQLIGL
jgi:hypothetical protein